MKIYGTSALSLNKKQSSTYKKYACGCFLYAPSICGVYFQKAYGEVVSERAWMSVVPRSSDVLSNAYIRVRI